jgi:hypothetical protein
MRHFIPYTTVFLIALTWLAVGCAGLSVQNTAAPPPTLEEDRLAAPPMPPNPTQADLGSHVYYQVCMACHGDRGQGLTDEWREVWNEDANCWQSECHGNDHPPEGFSFPQTCCAAVLGPGTLTQFRDGQALFEYLVETMPWWNPGYMPVEEFWQLTNFMMRENGVIPDGVTLNAGNAVAFNLHPVTPLPEDTTWQVLVIVGMLTSIAALLAFQKNSSIG